MGKREARPLSEVIEGLVPKLKPQSGRMRQRLWEAWREAVGEEKADQTRITILKRGELHVEVESPAMLQELTGMNKADIAAKMQERLGGVHIVDIKLKLTKD